MEIWLKIIAGSGLTAEKNQAIDLDSSFYTAFYQNSLQIKLRIRVF